MHNPYLNICSLQNLNAVLLLGLKGCLAKLNILIASSCSHLRLTDIYFGRISAQVDVLKCDVFQSKFMFSAY